MALARFECRILRPGPAVPNRLDAPRHARQLIAIGEAVGADFVRRCFDRDGHLVPGIFEGHPTIRRRSDAIALKN